MPYLLHYLPVPIYDTMWTMRNRLQSLFYRGKGFTCPICKVNLKRYMSYRNTGDPTCPRCRTSRRHRFYWYYLNEYSDLFDGRNKRVLHLAPEYYLKSIFQQRLGDAYLPTGYNDPRVKHMLDLNNANEADESFDVIICNHVLEHVPDDLKAMREIRRMLKPDGWALITVPQLASDKTFEDPAHKSPKERKQFYGQWDHLRAYGSDFAERLRSQGFAVESIYPQDLLSETKVRDLCLRADKDPLFIVRKT